MYCLFMRKWFPTVMKLICRRWSYKFYLNLTGRSASYIFCCPWSFVNWSVNKNFRLPFYGRYDSLGRCAKHQVTVKTARKRLFSCSMMACVLCGREIFAQMYLFRLNFYTHISLWICFDFFQSSIWILEAERPGSDQEKGGCFEGMLWFRWTR